MLSRRTRHLRRFDGEFFPSRHSSTESAIMAFETKPLYTERVMLKTFFTRAKRNIWILEGALFSIFYGAVIELTDTSKQLSDHIPNFSMMYLYENVSLFFFIAGIIGIVASLSKDFSFKSYIAMFSFFAVGGILRAASIANGVGVMNTTLVVATVFQILLLQANIWAVYVSRQRTEKLKASDNGY